MKKFIRRFAKYGWIIVAGSFACALLFYMYGNKKAQYYTASVVVKYDNGEDGKNPDGSDIDTSEIKSSYIIGKALKALDLDYNADTVSSQISITPIITEEEQALYESKLEHGEDYEIMSNQYTITLNASTTFGKDYAKKMLNQVLEEYMQYYGEKYIDTEGVTDNLDGIMDTGYDYIEMMDVIENSLSSSMETLNKKVSASDSFRSSTTGMSFTDLYKEFNFYYNKGSGISAKIINGKITKDRDVLLAKYKKKNSDMKLETSANTKKIDDIKKVIDSYVKMMEDSGNASFADKDILDAVYDEYNKDKDNSDHTTSYDELLQDYVTNRIGCEKNDIETAYNEYIIEKFTSANVASSENDQAMIKEDIQNLLNDTESLFTKFAETNADYNQYLGVQHIRPLSSVCIQKKLPVKKYTLMIAAAVFLLGTICFVVIFRMYDITKQALTEKNQGKERNHDEKD